MQCPRGSSVEGHQCGEAAAIGSMPIGYFNLLIPEGLLRIAQRFNVGWARLGARQSRRDG